MPLSESLFFVLDPLSKVPDSGLAIGMKSSIVMPILIDLYKAGVQDDRIYVDNLSKVDSKLYNKDDVIAMIKKNDKLYKRKKINNEINNDENNDHIDDNNIDQMQLDNDPDIVNDDDNDNQN